MTLDGAFRAPPRGRFVRGRVPLLTRVAVAAAGLCVAAALIAGAALALWLAMLLLPVALVAGLVAYAAFRFQLWRMRRAAPGAGFAPPVRRT